MVDLVGYGGDGEQRFLNVWPDQKVIFDANSFKPDPGGDGYIYEIKAFVHDEKNPFQNLINSATIHWRVNDSDPHPPKDGPMVLRYYGTYGWKLSIYLNGSEADADVKNLSLVQVDVLIGQHGELRYWSNYVWQPAHGYTPAGYYFKDYIKNTNKHYTLNLFDYKKQP